MAARLDLLCPRPREAASSGEVWTLPARPVVAVGSGEMPSIAVERLVTRLREAGTDPEAGGGAGGAVRLRLVASEPPGEAYRLTVGRDGVEVVAGEPVGIFRGVATLVQWLRIHAGSREIPGLVVRDAPAFAHRGLLWDVSRNKVPTLETLEGLVDLAADLKLDQLQLYFEHAFAYRGHEVVWRGADPLTADDVRRLDAYAAERFVELVPHQESFGHLHRWLVHEPYRRLAEVPEGIAHPFGPDPEPFSLCPLDPGSLELLADLYDQLLPCFRSRLFHVGLDETLDLGKGRSAEECERRGVGAVYLDFLRRVHRLVGERDHRALFWADVAAEHPEIVPELPADAIAVVWGYEAESPFAAALAPFAEAGIERWVAPGTSSWQSFLGRVPNMLGNVAAAARAGRDAGATGLLLCEWGDRGHLQPLPIAYPGIVAAAEAAWTGALDPASFPLAALLDLHVFRDRAGVLGRAVVELGSAYLETPSPINATAPFLLLMEGAADLDRRGCPRPTPGQLEAALARAESAIAGLAAARPERPDADLVRREIASSVDAWRLACRAGARSAPELARDFEAYVEGLRRVWLARNRPGGLVESEARLARAGARFQPG